MKDEIIVRVCVCVVGELPLIALPTLTIYIGILT